MLGNFLLMLAAVLFLIAAVWNPEPHRFRLVAAGLFCWSLGVLLSSYHIG